MSHVPLHDHSGIHQGGKLRKAAALGVADAGGQPGGGSGSGSGTDHGLLTGLGDDDHPQYATNVEFDDHSARHETGGADAIKLDDLTAPDDNTDLNVSITKHGLAPKAPNDATKYLDGTGAYTVPSGGSSGITVSDEGTPLSTTGTTLDFVGAGVTASGTGATKTITIPSGGSGGLVLLEQHTASASATLDFTTCISSTYDEYLIEIVGLIPATNATSLYLRMGTGGGPTWDSGSNYSTSAFRWVGTGGNAIGSTDPGTQIMLDGGNGTDTLRNDASYFGFSGSYHLLNGNPGTLYPNVFGLSQWVNSVPAAEMAQVQGRYNSHTSITGVRFLMSTGNITSGTIRIYGVSKT